MSVTEAIERLIEQWEDARARGETLTAEELCRERTELLEEVRKKIRALQAFEQFDKTPPTTFRGKAPAGRPDHLGDYEILGELGRGGMGVVYRARQRSLGRIVALKVLPAAAHASSEDRERFRREARAAAALQHPNIVQVFEVCDDAGSPFLAMEYLPGGSLAGRLDGTPWDPIAAAGLTELLAKAVAAAHRAGIIHRDLKPHNVLIVEEGTSPASPRTEKGTIDAPYVPAARMHGDPLTPKIADFGLAKQIGGDPGDGQTATVAVLGTPSYMSPEQASGNSKGVGPAGDIYSLGAILYQLITGRPPFKGANGLETLDQVRTREPVSPRSLVPAVPRDLETVCLKCLQKNPARRYVSAQALDDDLRRFLDGLPVAARPVGRLERAWKLARRRPTAAALIAVSALAIAVILAGSIWYNLRLESELERSERLFREGHGLARWLLADHITHLSKLRGGSAAQKRLAQQLLEYLDELSTQVAGHARVSSQVTIRDLAQAYERLGQVQGDPTQINMGESPAARDSFHKALELRRKELASRPHDPEARLGLAFCAARLANVCVYLKELDRASAAFDEAARALEPLGPPRLDDEQHQRVAFTLTSGRADMVEARGDRTTALQQSRALLDEVRAWVRAPVGEVRQMLLFMLCRVGRLLESLGDTKAAFVYYEEARTLSQELLREHVDDVRLQREVSVALLAYGDIVSTGADWKSAMGPYRSAYELRRTLAAADPNSVTAQRDLAASLERIGYLHERENRLDEAVATYSRALAIHRELAGTRASDVQNHRNLWIVLDCVGEAEMKRGNWVEAALVFQEQLRVSDRIDDDEGRGQAHRQLGRWTMAPTNASAYPADSLQRYKDALKHMESSVAAFDRLEKRAALTPGQQGLRKEVRGAIDFLRHVIEQRHTELKR